MARGILVLRKLVGLAGVFVALSSATALAQQAAPAQQRIRAAPADTYEDKKRQLSDIAVTIVTSGITCTCARFAEDIRDVVNDLRPDGLRVLPVLGVGGLQTLEDVLFLKGVDMGVVDEDNLRLLKKKDPRLHASLEQRVHYITRLYNNEFHIVARQEIKSYADLRGKKVSFNLKDSQSDITADAIFGMLKIDVQRVYLDNNEAMKQLRSGAVSAMVVVSGAPQSALMRFKAEDKVHFLPLDDKSLPGQDVQQVLDYYLPAKLTHEQYPGIIPEGQSVPTVANRALLVAYNWHESSPRYQRLVKFVDAFFDRIYQFHDGSRHPKWKEINVAAEVPGWTRFKPAADWLARQKGALATATPANPSNLKPAFENFVASYTAARGNKPLTQREAEVLFAQFKDFLRTQVTTQQATR